MPLTGKQLEALKLIPDEWGIPGSSQIHNMTLWALINFGWIEWNRGKPTRMGELNYGQFRRTDEGRRILGA